MKRPKKSYPIKNIVWCFWVFCAQGMYAQSLGLPSRLASPDTTAQTKTKTLSLSPAIQSEFRGAAQNTSYDLQIGPKIDFKHQKWSVTTLYAYGMHQRFDFEQQYIDTIQVIPGIGSFTKQGKGYSSHFFAGSLRYSASSFATLSLNYGKHFIGEGYRSLLYSDVSSPHLHGKIDLKFGKRFDYQVLFSRFTDPNPFNPSAFGTKKYGAFHYLTAHMAKNRIHLSFFESVIWGARDTLNQRGFDVRYLNPFVFYRPVEYSAGSADNSLIGVNGSIDVLKKIKLYSQLILDEFLLSEIKAGNGWWANKYGIQVGARVHTNLKQKYPLVFRVESNVVRPFTYTHGRTLESYTQQNQGIAHPLGANFTEFLGIATLRIKRSIFDAKALYYQQGIDTDSTNYGANILKSYTTRTQDYNNTLLQGIPKKVAYLNLDYYYQLKTKYPLYLKAGIGYRKENNVKGLPYISVGITTLLWNTYNDVY